MPHRMCHTNAIVLKKTTMSLHFYHHYTYSERKLKYLLSIVGLKILRCCDHCDIVGAIKGEKKFKGPHWHCYKCRNGFNRRDEAIKHYRTHFRNPQTTFQIQVAQVWCYNNYFWLLGFLVVSMDGLLCCTTSYVGYCCFVG